VKSLRSIWYSGRRYVLISFQGVRGEKYDSI